MQNLIPIVITGICLAATAAKADIRVNYIDTSPSDYFSIENVSGCLLTKGEVTIDFSTSSGQLVFDIIRNGWGDGDDSRSYQPLKVVSGQEFVVDVSDVQDGDNKVTFKFANFQHGDRITFNVDVDDTTGISHPSVSGSEIAGARLHVITPTIESEGFFDSNAVAETDRTTCIS